MSVAMTKADGVTVFTMTSDPQSSCPPLCQILKGLCYSPVWCSVSQPMRSVQRTSQSVLGALHIMVGLLTIGLTSILRGGRFWYRRSTLFPFWSGGLFMFFGVMSILSEKRPSPCLVLLNVILSVAGVAFAIASIILYSINMQAHMWFGWICDDHNYSHYNTPFPSSSPREEIMMERCLEGRHLIEMLMRSMNAVLIVLSVLELCVAISSGLLGIKARRSIMKGENKSVDDPEHHRLLLEEFTSTQTQPK